jgi:tetratricopeptide (TPR) repeat protein
MRLLDGTGTRGNGYELLIRALCFAILSAIPLHICLAQAGRSRAIVIGVHNYPNDPTGVEPLRFSHKDADIFQRLLRTARSGEFSGNAVRHLPDGSATLHSVRSELIRAIAGAQPKDHVYIFISARGLSRPTWRDGYIGTADMVASKPESTAVSVIDLKNMIKVSRAERIYLFADLCREPIGSIRENRIHLRLEEEFKNVPNVAGILASQPKRTSKEMAELTYGNERGFGVFARSLVTTLQERSPVGRNIGLKALFDEVANQVSSLTRNEQAPRLLGSTPAGRDVLVWRTASLPGTIQIAGLGRLPGLFALQADSPQSDLPYRVLEQRLDDPEGAVVEFRRLESGQHPVEAIERWRDRLAGQLADLGQNVVARYGTGDQFPDEPGKLQKEDFLLAERYFRAALQLVPDSDPVWLGFRRSLEAREQFCRGRALAFDSPEKARPILADARSRENPPIPEIDNAIGITYLEHRTGPVDLDRAIHHFRLAKSRSPAWAYPRHNLALAFLEQGNYKAAEREYREAIELTPERPVLYYNLGLLLHRSNRLKNAREAYEQAIAAFGSATKSYREREAEWMAEELAESAELAGRRAAALERNSAEAHNSLGALLAYMGDTNGAIASYKQALQMNEKLYPARHNMALLYQKQADWTGSVSPEAVKLLEEVRADNPDFHPSRLELARLYEIQGKSSQARENFEAVVHRVKGNIEAITGLARVLAAAQQFEPAVTLLLDAIKSQTEQSPAAPFASPILYVALAEVYTAAKNPDGACEAARTALDALKGSAHTSNRKALEKQARGCAEPNGTAVKK